VLVDGKKKVSEKGDILFTHFGVSGPTVLILSGIVIDALSAGNPVALSLQLRPAYTVKNLTISFNGSLSRADNHCFTVFERGSTKIVRAAL